MAKKTGQQSAAKRHDQQGAAKRLKITLVKSTIGFNKTQAETVRGMGLRRLQHTVELSDTPETRGMIHKVRHLVTVAE
jgi:large subunit ribosomal protein L30